MLRRCLIGLIVFGSLATSAAVREASPGLYDHLQRQRAGGVIEIRPVELGELPIDDPLHENWARVRDDGGEWTTWIDERTSFPTLALVRGLEWPESETLEAREVLARELLKKHFSAAGPREDSVYVDLEASGRRTVRFAQRVDGIPVEGARFEFHVSRGNLVALGSRLWSPVNIPSDPGLTADEARRKLDAYVRPVAEDGVSELGPPKLLLIPIDAGTSARGRGIAHRLVWRIRFTDFRGIATWTGEVDAHTGEIVAFWDDTHYDRIKGHVNPFTDDGLCLDQGCPEPDFPMPFVDFSQDGGPVEYGNQHGLYECTGPGTIETKLTGMYFRMTDQCGPISETIPCGTELDLGVAVGENCAVAPGASAGNTDAARASYYHLNMINRKARFWLSPNTWLDDTTVQVNTNTGGSCNASWNGAINMNAAGPSCGNTGQQQGIVTHEWGHGLDYNDGGGVDNPSEAYADIVAVIEGRQSCISRGFNRFNNCTGYGDTCLTCTGLREMDWDARLAHTPATPTGFLTTFCSGAGGGPCGKEPHCESHVSSEAIYDLAARDLPAMGLDADTAWQLTERLWYQSRAGSGGDGYNCSMPISDSCSAGTWYHQIRLYDDDDGNLSNGTPHAAAIFAAFDRHDIACGIGSDPENQNTSSCPALAAPVVSFTAGTDELDVQWGAVANAASYRVYRNEIGCDRAQVPLADVAGTSYLDEGLANGLPVYYRVQALGANGACESPVSNCLQAAPQQLAGKVRFDQAAYNCSGTIGLEVTDINHPTSSITVTVRSDTEATPENVVLTETPPASARYIGSIAVTSAAPAVDGQLSLADADTITAEYIDLDDGMGGVNVMQQDVALGDCVVPSYLSIDVKEITESSALIEWTTSEISGGQVEWGLTAALGNVVSTLFVQQDHSATIGPFPECARVYFRVTSVDEVGNVSVGDAAGVPFEFNAGKIQGELYADGFETDLGWTLEGEWEIGAPQGLGTPGDPSVAVEGSQVLGQDLSGQGAHPGDYEFGTVHAATSPVIDASSWTGVELRFDRWLQSHSSSWGAYLDVKASGGNWVTVWSDTNGRSDVVWTAASYDISTWAAGNPTLQIRFLQSARFGSASGWNVDRLALRDTTTPPFGACGGCAGSPTFAGLVTAVDVDTCADSGIELFWSAAPAWGTGSAGTYSVYRDLTPGFTPSGINLIASDIAGTTWTDGTAPTDTTVYYVVRAENDETCSTGPANGGVTETNGVEVSATNATGGAGSGSVGDTLGVGRYGADVRLTWMDVPGASGYTVERSSAADAGFTVVGQPSSAGFDDPGALGDGQTWFYLVTNTNACE
jgi:hypothetical protein